MAATISAATALCLMCADRERSRNPRDIVREIEHLVADGVVEVMLLGQNVNSYGKNSGRANDLCPASYRRLKKSKDLERIRFMTSHPKDLSDELIEVMKNSKKICTPSPPALTVRKQRYFAEDEPEI